MENIQNTTEQLDDVQQLTPDEQVLILAMRKNNPTLAAEVNEAMARLPVNEEHHERHVNSKRTWTAEERIALRIFGRIGYEGDLLRPPYCEEDKSDHVGLIYDVLVEEIKAGIIGLGMSERPLDELASAAESYYLGRQYTEGGAE